MSVTITVDPTSIEANSYVTAAMADAYFNERVNSSDWTDASADDRARALLEAARRIDSYMFFGEKWYHKQKMQFPRKPYQKVVSGVADSGTTTTLIDDTLANIDLYDPNEWKYAGIRITEGTNEGYARLVTGFNVSTGQLTFEAFPSAIDSTSQYTLYYKVPDEVRDAQCELALWIIQMGNDRSPLVDPNVQSESIGDYSVSYKSERVDYIVPDFVRVMLTGWISAVGKMINDRTLT